MLFLYRSNAVTRCAMMESIHQKHDVTWETYDEDMREALHRMMIENVLTDVTLVSDDQIKIQAHKIILNASSPVFQTFISSFEDLSRAVIYLKGVKYEELRHVLDFIYLGEISIEQDKLDTFLSLSENLQLKGVNDKQMKAYSHEENIVVHNEDDEDTFKKKKKKTLADSTEGNMFLHEDSINDLQEPDKKMFTDPTEEQNVLSDASIKEYLMRVDREESKKLKEDQNLTKNVVKLREKVKNSPGKLKCTFSQDCSQSFTMNEQLQKHIATEHLGNTFQCNECDFQSKFKGNLRHHKLIQHSDTFFFFCSQCKYKTKEKSTLNIHTQVEHEGFRFSCKYCDWAGRNTRYLLHHMKKVHKIKLEIKKGPKPKQTIFQYYGQEAQETNYINSEDVSQSETESPENELECDNIILETEDGASAVSAAACGYCGECFDDEDELNHHMVSLCVVQKLNPGVRKIIVRK